MLDNLYLINQFITFIMGLGTFVKDFKELTLLYILDPKYKTSNICDILDNGEKIKFFKAV